MSATIPTISTPDRERSCPGSGRPRCARPIGLSPGKYLRANASLTIATGGPPPRRCPRTFGPSALGCRASGNSPASRRATRQYRATSGRPPIDIGVLMPRSSGRLLAPAIDEMTGEPSSCSITRCSNPQRSCDVRIPCRLRGKRTATSPSISNPGSTASGRSTSRPGAPRRRAAPSRAPTARREDPGGPDSGPSFRARLSFSTSECRARAAGHAAAPPNRRLVASEPRT